MAEGKRTNGIGGPAHPGDRTSPPLRRRIDTEIRLCYGMATGPDELTAEPDKNALVLTKVLTFATNAAQGAGQ